MADLTNMISSQDAERVSIDYSIEQPLQSKVEHRQDDSARQFLKHYQQFIGEQPSEALWRDPSAFEQKFDRGSNWLRRCQNALVKIVASLIR